MSRYSLISLALLPALAAAALPPAAVKADGPALKICASAKQLPYSSQDNSGFENKIAILVAKAMNREPVFVYADKPAIYLVRDWLDQNKCDVVVGLDSSDDRVLTTRPYYKTGYVFVTRKTDKLNPHSWRDPELRRTGHIVVDFGSPSETMLRQIDRYDDNMSYLYSLVGFRSPRNEYVQIPPEKMIAEVKGGGADLAVAFAPDVARYVKGDPSLRMTPVKDDAVLSKGDRLPQQYDQSMGVRKGDTELQSALNAALIKAGPEIEAVLKQEGIPLIPAAHR